jgi:dolichyl-phosphate-mannose-protein mannosyltransferase
MLERARAAIARVPAWAWALAFALALCLPRLGSFGFWDPSELKLAEQARDIARSNDLFDATADGHYPARPPLDLSLSALGIRLFGANELGARLVFALAGIAALMAVYWAGAGLLRRRAALLATLALGTMPMFVLEARQLTSDTPLIAALALALGALGRFAWPADGTRRWSHFAVAVVAILIGALAGGGVSGVALPILPLVAALLVGYGLTPRTSPPDDGTAALAAPGLGRDVAADQPIGASILRPSALGFWGVALLAVAAIGVLVLAMSHAIAAHYSPLLGGVPRGGAPTRTFETLVRELGFGLFPWSAVAVFALARPLIRLDGDADPSHPRSNPRLAFVELYLLFFASFGFALSSYKGLALGEARYVALPAIALAVGAFLDEALAGNRPEPVTGLLMAIGTMIVARDFYQAPEDLGSVHLYEKIRWPATLAVGNQVLAFGFIAAMGVYAGLAARAETLASGPALNVEPRPRRRRVAVWLAAVGGRFGLQTAVVCAMAFAFYLSQVIVPHLSTHLSFKPVLQSYAKFARNGEKIGRYRVESRGSSFYNTDTIVDLTTQDRLVAFLRDPDRVFALVAADELAALDAAFKQAAVPYYVVDGSSSRFLLVTNRLAADQRDENPLLKNVWSPPAGVAAAKPPWTWRVPASATFGDAIELVGADFPESLRRPGKIPLDLYFHVKARPPAGYKIFVHFDGPAAPRLIGDHDPVNHAFGTGFWLPGEYVRDHWDTDAPLMTTPAGSYAVYIGFWPGGEGKRLKVTEGADDGADRVRLGTLEIK